MSPQATATFEEAVQKLGHALSELDAQPHRSGFPPYRFYTPTPETHGRVLRRLVEECKAGGDVVPNGKSAPAPTLPRAELALRATTLREFWGWSMSLSLATGEVQDEDARRALRLFTFLQRSGIDAASPLLSIEKRGGPEDADDEKEATPAEILFRPIVRFSNLYAVQRSPHLRNDEAARELQLLRERVLYAHSAFSTSASSDAVFFGPDTYRFVAFLHRALAACRAPSAARTWKLGLDVGTGAGAGALALADLRRSEGPAGDATDEGAEAQARGRDHLVGRVMGSDTNPTALSYARANAALYHDIISLAPARADADADTSEGQGEGWTSRLAFREASLLSGLSEAERDQVDLVVSNPPYIAFASDEGGNESAAAAGPAYADGGAQHGLALPLQILRDALSALRPGGLALLYTGVPVGLDGVNPLWEACQAYDARAQAQEKDAEQDADPSLGDGDGIRAQIDFWETMDVDVFGDELEHASGPYGHSGVGSIQVVGVGMRRLE